MPQSLSPQTREIIKACIPALQAHGVDITKEMYRRLLSNKEIRDLFNMSHQKTGEQPKALAFAVLAYAQHIDHPGELKDMVERIAQKHVGLNILPQHYPYVGKALLEAIAHVLGDAATPQIMQAWKEAYIFLADLLIGREGAIYKQHEKAPDGWVGWRPFKIAKRTKETPDTVSFELKPADGQPVMEHSPGQYLSFRLNPPEHGSQRRNYTISSAPSSEHYRITVKRQKDGIISNWWHDNVKEGDNVDVSAPAGEFTLTSRSRPITFIAAGSGITPIMAMVQTLAEHKAHPPMHLFYMVHSPQDEIFASDIEKLAAKGIIKADIFYTRHAPAKENTPSITYHHGHINPHVIGEKADKKGDFYICGPSTFMLTLIDELKKDGIPPGHIYYEMFGSAATPGLVTRAA